MLIKETCYHNLFLFIFFLLKKVVKIVTALPKVSLNLSGLIYLSAFSHSKDVGSSAVTDSVCYQWSQFCKVL